MLRRTAAHDVHGHPHNPQIRSLRLEQTPTSPSGLVFFTFLVCTHFVCSSLLFWLVHPCMYNQRVIASVYLSDEHTQKVEKKN